MTPSQGLAAKLVEDFPGLAPLMEQHLEDQEGELLPYLLMADVARWAQAEYSSDPETVGRLVDWLEAEFERAQPAEKDLIGLGFVEVIPAPPEGAPLLIRLGPHLTQVAQELGVLGPHE
jgi:hypothetical protein